MAAFGGSSADLATLWREIARAVVDRAGGVWAEPAVRSVGGGCINQTYRLTLGERSYLVKLNQASGLEMFAAGAAGLADLAGAAAVKVPQPLCYGQAGDRAYLVLEWLELGRGDGRSWEQLGRDLATLHRWPGPEQAAPFGWHRPNTIGSTPQPNEWAADWATFWAERRIGFQLQLAQRRGGHFPQGDRLLAAIPH
ncbi:MAG TPA: fructosamine kinase family protein, partial [Coleofasciculaceae cyanobacterium]